MNVLLGVGITDGPVVIVTYLLAGAAFVLLLVRRPSRRWRRMSWAAVSAVSAVGGGVIGLGLTWLLSDRLDLFDADLTPVVRGWIIAGFVGVGLAVASIIRSTWRRAIGSVLAAALFVGTAAMGVNVDFGQYPTIGSALGISSVKEGLPSTARAGADAPTIDSWRPPADMPSRGALGSVDIPGTVSGFRARPAVVYLPPAALTRNPPRLPVLIMMSGQPGRPENPLVVDRLGAHLDAYAAEHRGLAPIVVSPDQLGSPDINPMCIDSARAGNSATYLTVDVPHWIRTHLNATLSPGSWGVGGLSQGGTCASQLGAEHPELFDAILDASGQLHPSLGSDEKTIAEGFGGDAAAFAAAAPAAIMTAHAPYKDTIAVLGVGALDVRFKPGIETLASDARAAGMTTHYIEVPNTAHDSHAWRQIFARGLTLIADHWGLDR
ncbi:alpha/beta hydrolase [Microbacterium oleivorans]|uniref:alpha/beta hydrolase n=1 Tax=Microbacterium oleivorans TaxID=273677 RepID=UPI000767B9F4|nr:alpha/beta hydrolase-fold protein [Microbacterium oleivorans]